MGYLARKGLCVLVIILVGAGAVYPARRGGDLVWCR